MEGLYFYFCFYNWIGAIMEKYDDIINVLASSDYYVIKKDIDKLLNNSSFLNEITKVHNPFVFDRFIKMCEYKTDISYLCEKRKKFIKNALINLNNENIYSFFELSSYDKYKQKDISNRYLMEYIVFYYFEDNYYNFMTNLYQMIDYLGNTKKDLVDKENINLYKEFVELRNMSFEDKIRFFNSLLNNTNIKEMFYDDMSIVREDSHKELVDKTIKLNHDSKIYKEDISKKLGVDVYNLNGEEFYGFVRCLLINRNYLFNYFDYVFSQRKRLGYSFSYIGDKNIGTTDYNQKNVVLFYDKIDYRDIMYVHHADLHAKRMNIQNDYLSEKVNEIITPRSLIVNTKNYNEVYIKSNGKSIIPTALVCYDTITENDIGFAKKYKLSILVINRNKYKRYETYDDDYMDNTYVL